jgi:hypothetical protein
MQQIENYPQKRERKNNACNCIRPGEPTASLEIGNPSWIGYTAQNLFFQHFFIQNIWSSLLLKKGPYLFMLHFSEFFHTPLK